MTDKRPTQNEVAKLAGVSRVTVSLVMSGKGETRVPISEETRRRVLDAARQVGYSPNPVAQMLARGSNQLIGIFTYENIFPYEQNNFYFRFLSGIEREASRHDYNVLLFTRNSTSGVQRQVYVDRMNTLRLADGALLMGAFPNHDDLRRLVSENYPFVYIGRRLVSGCDFDWVSADYASGSEQATDHLIRLGHRKIALVVMEKPSEPMQARMEGCLRAQQKAPDVELIRIPNIKERIIPDFLKSGATALICLDTGNFRPIYEQLRAEGVRIPEEISILSLASSDSPDLSRQVTHVNVNRALNGETAVRILIDRLKGGHTEPQHVFIPCHLVEGDTTAPPRT